MKRSQLSELHYITPLSNIESILQKGILSHNKAKRYKPASVAMKKIQEIRSKVVVPGGLRLHDYANLYFTARNPMLYKIHTMHTDLAVIRVSTDVLDFPGVVITDGNASSGYTAFWPSPDGLENLNHGLIFARNWTDPDWIQYLRKKRAKCAEVLVPESVPPRFTLGVYVSHTSTYSAIRGIDETISINENLDVFFLS